MLLAIQHKSRFFLINCSLFCLFLVVGCGYQPDTSAPERVEVTRVTGWQGSLLYIADETGPTQAWGSIRVYDNISGFVEITVEQVKAAAPSDMYVTPDGGSLFAASSANGVIEKFRWDGNSWIRAGVIIETPASSLLTLKPGPDGQLYAVDGTPASGRGQILTVDPRTDKSAMGMLSFPDLGGASGISWSNDGATAFIAGTSGDDNSSVLLVVSWPSAQIMKKIDLPLAHTRQAVTSPDGKSVYIMGSGSIAKVDVATGAVSSSLNPSPEASTDYADADFSADGSSMFVTGSPPGGDSNLYIVSLETGLLLNEVKHISAKAGGIQRVE